MEASRDREKRDVRIHKRNKTAQREKETTNTVTGSERKEKAKTARRPSTRKTTNSQQDADKKNE